MICYIYKVIANILYNNIKKKLRKRKFQIYTVLIYTGPKFIQFYKQVLQNHGYFTNLQDAKCWNNIKM